MKNIGIIGIGRMGHALAMNLLKHGYSVNFYSPPPSPFEEKVISLGGHKKESISQLGLEVDAIILCVTGTPEVEQVVFGQMGLLENIVPGTVVIDCSTAIPESTLKVAAALNAKGVDYLDAAMTRTPKEAEEGRLNLLVGASQGMFDKCLPIFKCFAENIEHVGPVSYGHRLKLIHNFVSLGFSALLAEAVACANAANINTNSLVEVLSKGGGGGVIMQRFEPYIRNRDDTNFRFTISNANKDLGYYLAMAAESNASSAIANAVSSTYENAVIAGKADLSVPQMIDLLAPGSTKS
jgi:3-hydroxyisobutyrate dehydrogenase